MKKGRALYLDSTLWGIFSFFCATINPCNYIEALGLKVLQQVPADDSTLLSPLDLISTLSA
ncbi:MAG: hypothetical protein ACI8WT_002715 [Clostridium sp.]|jgi:hypothetical protein